MAAPDRPTSPEPRPLGRPVGGPPGGIGTPQPGSKHSYRSRPTVRSPPITAMSISEPGSAPRLRRSSRKNSTCPLRASSWCWAIPRGPNQGPTIASETIQITAVPLRKAAAQARRFLLARAAERLELRGGRLAVEDGLIRGQDNRSVSYGELIAGETIRLELADDVPVKAVDAYRIVGQSRAAHRSSGQGDRRTGLCPRRACARHAARPRGAPALCRRRCGRLSSAPA